MRAWMTVRQKHRLVLAVKALIVAVLLFDLAVLLPATRLVVFALLEGGLRCPLSAALRTHGATNEFASTWDRLKGQVRLIRREPGRDLWETPRGPTWFPSGSDSVLPYNMAEQELRIYGDDRLGVRPGDVVLDCGAHVGLYTREALRQGARLVVAIEPSPENLDCLRLNLSGELAAGRLIIYPKGVWDREVYLPLHIPPQNSAGSSLVAAPIQGEKVVNVPLTTIDNLVAELRLDRVDFIKMDIEGAERRALAGARQTLATYKPRLAIAGYHLPDDHLAIPAAVRGAWRGYGMTCRVCTYRGRSMVPEVLFFY